MNINQFFESLAANNSRNFKLDTLKAHSDDKLLKEVIRLALDPFTNFHIRKIPTYTISGYNRSLSQSIEMLGQLSARVYTGNAGIQFLTDILSNSMEGDDKVIERIIKKDLKCGVSISTANAVWPNLIQEYPCMLCSPYEDKLVNKIKYPAYVQCLSSDWIIETDKGKFAIKDIVESDDDFLVKSYDVKSNVIQYNRVLGKSKTPNISKQWFIITLEDGTVSKPITSDHLVWCENKKNYIRVDELTDEDSVLYFS